MQTRTTAAAVALAMAGVTAQTDIYTGIWMLNLARTGGESRTQTLTIEIHGDQESYRSELVRPNVRRQMTSYVAKCDERECSVSPDKFRILRSRPRPRGASSRRSTSCGSFARLSALQRARGDRPISDATGPR